MKRTLWWWSLLWCLVFCSGSWYPWLFIVILFSLAGYLCLWSYAFPCWGWGIEATESKPKLYVSDAFDYGYMIGNMDNILENLPRLWCHLWLLACLLSFGQDEFDGDTCLEISRACHFSLAHIGNALGRCWLSTLKTRLSMTQCIHGIMMVVMQRDRSVACVLACPFNILNEGEGSRSSSNVPQLPDRCKPKSQGTDSSISKSQWHEIILWYTSAWAAGLRDFA